MTARREIDWGAIEQDYHAGVLPIRTIARQHQISETAIRKRAKQHEWKRTPRSRRRAAEKLAGVLEPLPEPDANNGGPAESAEVLKSHQGIIRQALDVVHSLIGELGEATENRHEIEKAIEMETAPDANRRRRASMLKATSLTARAQTSRELSQSLKNLVPLDRQVSGMEEGGERGEAAEQDHVVNVYIPTNNRD